MKVELTGRHCPVRGAQQLHAHVELVCRNLGLSNKLLAATGSPMHKIVIIVINNIDVVNDATTTINEDGSARCRVDAAIAVAAAVRVLGE